MTALGRLDFLLGLHQGLDHLHESPWTSAEDAAAMSEARYELGGTAIVRRTRDDRSTAVFDTIEVFLADPSSGDVLLYSFDSLGYPPDPPARGRWVGGTLELRRVTARGESRTVFVPGGDGASGFAWSKQFRATPGEAWQPVVDGTFA